MKKIKYYYNTNTLRYEKLETPLRVILLRVFAFIATAFVTSAIISYFAFQFVGSPNERLLRNENERLQDRYRELNRRASSLQQGTIMFTEPFLKPLLFLIAQEPENWRSNRKLQWLKE